MGRGPAQVALNWVTSRAGVRSTLVGVTGPEQLTESLRAMEFEILPDDLLARLDQVSQPEPDYPYDFFGPRPASTH
jgi:aryl-alcohol dehydrogenase-like predicted oxidoreductase